MVNFKYCPILGLVSFNFKSPYKTKEKSTNITGKLFCSSLQHHLEVAYKKKNYKPKIQKDVESQE